MLERISHATEWLLGPEGAGIFYCRRDLIARTHPPMIGWANTVGSANYDRYDFTLKPTACSTAPKRPFIS